MKNFLVMAMIFASSSVFASKFATIDKLTNPVLEKSRNEITKLSLTTHFNIKKVTRLSAAGSTPREMRQNTVAQAMHTLCRFFDDGVSIGINTKDHKGSMIAVDNYNSWGALEVGSDEYITLVNAIKAANAEAGVEVYSGGASGNNTAGDVLGFYDVKNNELAVFADTNCGSDS